MPPFLKPLRLLRILVLSAATALGSTAAAQDTPKPEAPKVDAPAPGDLFEKIPLPVGISKEAYQDAIAQTLTERGWAIVEKNDRRVSGKQTQKGNVFSGRSIESTVTLIFSGVTTDIYCEGWEVDRNGARTKPEIPRNALNILKRELSKRLATVASTR